MMSPNPSCTSPMAATAMLTTMFASLAALFLTAFLYFTRFLGHTISFKSLGFLYFYGLSYKTPHRIITVGKFNFKLKRPTSLDPTWAKVTIQAFEYKDNECHVSMEYCLTKLWFFPVLHRFSFGPWIDAMVNGVAVHVYESRNTPSILDGGRKHLVASALNGETIRIGHMGTQFFFGKEVKTPVTYESDSEGEGEGQARDEKQAQVDAQQEVVGGHATPTSYNGSAEKGRRTEYERDDVRIRFGLEQWQMVTFNHRIYTFGELQGELRRSWLDDRGSMVLIMKEVAWTKLPYVDHPVGKGRGKLWEILRAMWYFPSDLFTLVTDPVALVDIHVGRCDVTFCDFRLRDAEMLKQGTVRLKQEHFALEQRYPGIIGDIAWDMFVHGVHDLCKEKERDD